MPTKAGTAYVDIVGNFAPLNRQIARMGRVSTQASKSFSRSMKVVSREAEDSRRRVARLSREISGIGPAAQSSSRQTVRAMRQVEASSARALKALRAVEAAQRRAAVAPRPRIAGGGARPAGAPGQQAALNPTVAALVPVISKAAVEAAAATAARQAATRIGTIGASRNAYSTYGLARSFGRGRAASTVAEVGARASSALSMGKSFAGAFAKGLGPGLATVGVERILTSALKGDMKSAGFQAGGALVGGLLGSIGGPGGAMLGAGIGSFAGDLIGGLFDDGDAKKEVTLQQKIAASARQVSMAYRGLQASSRTLARSGEGVVRSHNRARKASRDVAAAERQLTRARRQFGPNSRQASQAEQRLANARQRSARASKQVQRAERLHGLERKVQEKILKGTILEERHYQNQLKKNEKQLRKQIATAYQNGRSFQTLEHLKGKLAKNQKELTDSQKRQNEVLGEASRTIGPKYARYLKNASGELLRTSKRVKAVAEDVKKPARAFSQFGKASEQGVRRAKGSVDKLKGSLSPFAQATGTQMGKAAGAMKSFDRTTTGALTDVKWQTQQTLIAFGVSTKGFAAKKQKGGAIVPGTGEGDTFPTTLPVGSFVLNKKATAAFGFQRGGNVPVMLEPGERVFMPHEVQQVGRRRLQDMNSAVPRFQTGGEVGGTAKMVQPVILGPEPLRSVGQKAVEQVFNAAIKLIRREAGSQTYAAVLKEANRIDALRLPYVWGGGHQSTPAPANGPFDCSGAVSRLLQGAGFKIPTMVSGGFESFGSPGKGKVSILANPEHVYAVIGGRAWGTSGENPGGGAGWIDSYTYRSGFATRHADVTDLKVIRAMGSKKGQPLKKGYAHGGPVQQLATGGNVARIVGPILLRNGLDVESAAGILGNAWQESTWNPGAIEPGTHNGGLWGFTAPPKDLASMKSYAASQGVPWTNAKAQTQFMLHLLPRSMRRAMNRMSSVESTTQYFMEEWERPDPAQSNFARRVEGAKMALQILGGEEGEVSDGGGEKIPATYRGCSTSRLTFPAVPKELPQINREIARRQGEVKKYRKAARYATEKDRRPGVAAALQKNVEVLEARLAELRGERQKVRVEKAKKALKKGLKRKLGKIAGYEQQIEGYGRAFEIGTQEAEQLVALEPQPSPPPPGADDKQKEKEEKDYVQAFTKYVEVDERNAYTGLLGRAADWRNAILKAEYFGFGEKQPSVARMQHTWENEVDQTAGAIDHINTFTKKVADRVADWRREHKGKELPEGLKAQIRERDRLREKLPWLRFKEGELRQAVGQAREHFFPGGKRPNGKDRIHPPPLPLPGSGSLEEALNEVQGVHWPDPWHHQELPASALAPPRVAGRFGGVIWDVQTSIEELGLKIRDAAGSLEESTSGDDGNERLELENELLRQAAQRASVAEAQFAVFRDFDATYPVGEFPPYAGKAHSGAVVPGPPNREKTMIVRGQERIRTPEQELAMAEKIRRQAGGDGASLPQLVVNGNIVQEPGDTRDPVEAVINDRRFPVAVRRVAMGGRVTPGGARS